MLSLLMCSAAFADLVIVSDEVRVNYYTEDSSGKFTETKDVLPPITEQVASRVPEYDAHKYPYYCDIAAFKVGGKNRVLVIRRDSDDLSENNSHFMIFDPEDFSKPIASNDFTLPHGHTGGFEWALGNSIVLGNNIIFAQSNKIYASIAELNIGGYDPEAKTLYAADADTFEVLALKLNDSGVFGVPQTVSSMLNARIFPAIVSKVPSSGGQQSASKEVSEEVRQQVATTLGKSEAKEVDSVGSAKTATTKITQAISDSGYTINDTLASVNVSEAGTYCWPTEVASTYQGKNVSDYKIYLVNFTTGTYSSAVSAAAPSGMVEATALGTDGKTITTIPESILIAADLADAGEYGVYVASAASSSIGNSSSGCDAGFGVLSLMLMAVMLRKKI